MTVKELKEELSKLNPNAEVYIDTTTCYHSSYNEVDSIEQSEDQDKVWLNTII